MSFRAGLDVRQIMYKKANGVSAGARDVGWSQRESQDFASAFATATLQLEFLADFPVFIRRIPAANMGLSAPKKSVKATRRVFDRHAD